MVILVTGANGQLGNEMRMVSQDSKDKYIFTDVAELDITNLEAIREMVKQEEVKAIINCAAYTNVDKAEEDIDFCTLLNATAVENLAIAMKEVDGLLVHVSTDYVFGGDPYNTPCTEDNHRQFFVPRGFAHGFAVLSETAVFQYKCDNFYAPEADGGISIMDESLGIDWQIPTENAILSEKDIKHVCLKDFDSPFDINEDLYQ